MSYLSADEILSCFGRLLGGRRAPFAFFNKTLSGRVIHRRSCRSCRALINGTADCAHCKGENFRALSPGDIINHINGRAAVGIYPTGEDGLCRFFLIELSGEAPAVALKDLSNVCETLGADCIREITDFGRRARLWLLLGRGLSPEAAIWAAARIIEKAWLRTGGVADCAEIFPLKSGLPGKPAVLPLFDSERGYSFLVDRDIQPIENEQEFLASLEPRPLVLPPEKEDELPPMLKAELCGSLYVDISGLSRCRLASLCRSACFVNPDANEFSDEPAIAACFSVFGNRLILPRAADLGEAKIERHGSRTRAPALKLRAGLTHEQKTLAMLAMRRGCGILTSPVGSGKTLVICSILEKLHRTALILVPDAVTARRWHGRLCELFGLAPGSVGLVTGDSDFPGGILDVALLCDNTELRLAEYISSYGVVIVADGDRLNCSGAEFRAVMEAVCAENIWALTSRPVGETRLKDYIRLYCGVTIEGE